MRNHGEHAYHIVMGTDIFGLSEEEKQVVANVVYYHYKGTPSDDDAYFNALTELQKIQVTKLVAVIRVACACLLYTSSSSSRGCTSRDW